MRRVQTDRQRRETGGPLRDTNMYHLPRANGTRALRRRRHDDGTEWGVALICLAVGLVGVALRLAEFW